MCILCRNVYILYVLYIYTVQVCMTTSHIVMHYIGLVCQSPNSQEAHVVNGILCSF